MNNSKINESLKIKNNENLSNMNAKDVKGKRLRFNKKLNSNHLSNDKGYLNRIETTEEVSIYFWRLFNCKYSLKLHVNLTAMDHILTAVKEVF